MQSLNKFFIAATLSVWLPISASACSVIITTDIFFEKNASSISEKEFSKLSRWLKKARSDYPNASPISLSTNVEENEVDGEHLGRQRELAVRLAIIDIDPSSPTTKTFEKVFSWNIGAPGELEREDVKRVELQYFPKGNFCGGG